jgi:arylformamidase
MTIIDISVPLDNSTPVWPGSPRFSHNWTKRIVEGDSSNDSTFICCVHAGTHVDAPLHFVRNGSPVDEMSLDALCGPAYVADLSNASVIDEEALSSCNIPDGAERILFLTKNSVFWRRKDFEAGFVALSESGARWLVRREARLIGIDYLSIGPYPDGRTVHATVLSAGIAVIEGLDLSRAAEGWYDLYCLPLKIKGAEGAPCRAVLIPPQKRIPENNNGK